MDNILSLNQNQDLAVLDYTPSVLRAGDRQEPELPNLYRGAPVEILGEDGQAMISGLITGHDGREITIGRRPGGLSFRLCEIGSSVVIQGCDIGMAQFYLRATVAESSRIHMRLKDLEQKEVPEDLRDTFRLMVNAPIFVFDHADEHMKLPKACTLMDISTSGCCILSRDFHQEGEVLRLRIKLEDYRAIDLVGEIIRVTECGDGGFCCGILFAQLKKEELDALAWMLFNLQVGNRKEYSWA